MRKRMFFLSILGVLIVSISSCATYGGYHYLGEGIGDGKLIVKSEDDGTYIIQHPSLRSNDVSLFLSRVTGGEFTAYLTMTVKSRNLAVSATAVVSNLEGGSIQIPLQLRSVSPDPDAFRFSDSSFERRGDRETWQFDTALQWGDYDLVGRYSGQIPANEINGLRDVLSGTKVTVILSGRNIRRTCPLRRHRRCSYCWIIGTMSAVSGQSFPWEIKSF